MNKFYLSIFIFINIFICIYANPIFDNQTNFDLFEDIHRNDSIAKPDDSKFNIPIDYYESGYQMGRRTNYLTKPSTFIPFTITTALTAASCLLLYTDWYGNPSLPCLITTGSCITSTLVFGNIVKDDLEEPYNKEFKRGYRSGKKRAKLEDAFLKSSTGCITGIVLGSILLMIFE